MAANQNEGGGQPPAPRRGYLHGSSRFSRLSIHGSLKTPASVTLYVKVSPMMNRTKLQIPDSALRTMTILIDQAGLRLPITYGAILDKMGIRKTRGAYSRLTTELNIIAALCVGIGIPLLSAIAVNASGKPGKGFDKWASDVNTACAEVFVFDWRSVLKSFLP